jgi:hypothetical protein
MRRGASREALDAAAAAGAADGAVAGGNGGASVAVGGAAPSLETQLSVSRAEAASLASELAALKTRLQARGSAPHLRLICASVRSFQCFPRFALLLRCAFLGG